MVFGVSASTDEIKVNDPKTSHLTVQKQLDELSEGVYLFRTIQFEENHKLETHGHSTVYIKYQKAIFYFDTQLGLYDLSQGKEELIFNSLLSANQHFHIDYSRFHKLFKKSVVDVQTTQKGEEI